ncbi:MAG: DUF1854 domain-containing protein [Planctomycetia bacterium]|nr:DUF1854 domain-containing protein [Planctomycetia bacterium]
MNSKNGDLGDFALQNDAWGRLVLIDGNGKSHEGVEPVRDFPISDPDHWISICDAQGRELVSVKDLGAISPATREFLERDLARREFVPLIRRVVGVPADTEPTEWEVETDRGPTKFLLNSADDVRRLGPDRALVIDTQGIRYLIEDLRQLDAASRRILERYL